MEIRELAERIYNDCVAIRDGDKWDYDCIGVRCDSCGYKIGDEMDISYQHYGDDTGHEFDYALSGTSTTKIYNGMFDGNNPEVDDIINAIEYNVKHYSSCGRYTYIVCGDYGGDGNDIDELVVKNARVYAIVGQRE